MNGATRSYKSNSYLYLPKGWVEIESSITEAIESYTTENSLKFDGGWVEVRHYNVVRPVESIWSTSKSSYFLDIYLAPSPVSHSRLVSLPETADLEARGRIQIVPPGQKVQVKSSGGNFRSMRCVLDADFIDSILQHKAQWSENSLRSAFKLNGGTIEWLLMKIYRELKEPRFGTKTVIESYVRAVAVEVIRQFNLDEKVRPEDKYTGGLASWRMRLLTDRINSDETPPSLEDLADLCSMNVRHLGRAFKEQTGQTLGRFIKSSVIERARRMLTETDAPVHQIAEKLGYATSGSFAYAFRQATGLLPSEIERRSMRSATRSIAKEN